MFFSPTPLRLIGFFKGWRSFINLKILRITFYTCLALAFLLHASGLLVYGLSHDSDIKNVPFEVIRVKLGNAQTPGKKMSRDFSPYMQPSSALPQIQAPIPVERPETLSPPTPHALPAPIARPALPATPAPAPAPVVAPAPLPAESIIRGSPLGNTNDQAAEEEINTYKSLLALWFRRHQVYPKEAQRQKLEGRGLLLIVIDREGRIHDYAIARSTGHTMLDRAMIAMMDRANPVPRLPDSYTAPLYHARIPIEFKMTSPPK